MKRSTLFALVAIVALVAFSGEAWAKGGGGDSATPEPQDFVPWSLTVALVLGAAAALFVARIIRTGGCTDDNGWLLPMGTLLALMIVVAVTTSIVWAIEAGDPISVLRSGGRYGIFIVTGTLISSILTPARRSTEPPK